MVSWPQTVTHPGTNQALRRVTTLIETNALPLCVLACLALNYATFVH